MLILLFTTIFMTAAVYLQYVRLCANRYIFGNNLKELPREFLIV